MASILDRFGLHFCTYVDTCLEPNVEKKTNLKIVLGNSENETKAKRIVGKLSGRDEKNLNRERAAVEMAEIVAAIHAAAEMAEIFAAFQLYQFPSSGWQG